MHALSASSTAFNWASEAEALLDAVRVTNSITLGKRRPAQKASVPDGERDAAMSNEKTQLRAAIWACMAVPASATDL